MISVKHAKESEVADGADDDLVQPSDWNAEHVLTQATGKLLGRTTASTGAVEEIAPGSGITLANGEIAISGALLFGSGVDGDVTVSTGVTLARDMHYDDLTIVSGGSINTNGFRIFVAGTLDLTAAPANAIQRNGNSNGTTSGTNAIGAQATNMFAGTLGGSSSGANAGAGGTTNGANATSQTQSGYFWGGRGGAGGAGGNGSSGNGGTTSISLNRQAWQAPRHIIPDPFLSIAASQPTGAYGGGGGGGGGGDGTAGGGGGGGGGAAGILWVAARKINRGGGTAAGAISAKGGNGAAGSNASGGNRGGGGASGGGGGGVIFIIAGELLGSTAADALDVSGGNGANGGNGAGTGTAGGGGQGGDRGSTFVWDLKAGTCVEAIHTDTVGAASGQTGGTGIAGLEDL